MKFALINGRCCATSIGLLMAALTAGGAGAQELEPRQYSNAPIGMNFLVAGYANSSSGVLFDPSIALDNAELEADGPVVGYARALSLGGLSAKIEPVSAMRACPGRRITRGSTSRATSADSATRRCGSP